MGSRHLRAGLYSCRGLRHAGFTPPPGGDEAHRVLGGHAMKKLLLSLTLVGLLMLGLTLIFALMGKVNRHHAERLEVISIYWHFVDAVWVVVFTVVYIVGR